MRYQSRLSARFGRLCSTLHLPVPCPRTQEASRMHGISLPQDFQTNFLMALRWIHFLAGITWIGLLYFFNLVGFAAMKELDPATRGKVMPGLMLRALWWFRWSALVTVLAGLAYWGQIVSAEGQAAGAWAGTAVASFFLIWTITWAILYA